MKSRRVRRPHSTPTRLRVVQAVQKNRQPAPCPEKVHSVAMPTKYVEQQENQIQAEMIAQLSTNLSKSTIVCEQLESSKNRLEAELITTRQELSTLKATHIQAITQLNRRLEAKELELVNRDTMISQIKQELDTYRRKADRVLHSEKNASKEFNSTEVRLSNEIRQLRREVEQEKSKRQQSAFNMQREMSDLNKIIQEKDIQLEKVQATSNQLHQQLHELQHLSSLTQHEFQSQSVVQRKEQKKIAQLQQQLIQENKKSDALTKMLEQESSKSSQLEQKLQEESKLKDQSLSKAQSYHQKYNSVIIKCKKLQSQYQHSQSTGESNRAKMQVLNNDKKKLQQREQQLQQELTNEKLIAARYKDRCRYLECVLDQHRSKKARGSSGGNNEPELDHLQSERESQEAGESGIADASRHPESDAPNWMRY